MEERLVPLSISAGQTGQTLGDNFEYHLALKDLTVVGIEVSPTTDDSGMTFDLNDDGTGVITGVSCADADSPGSWKSTAMGGSEDPVHIAAGSIYSYDVNNAAESTGIKGTIWCLTGASNS